MANWIYDDFTEKMMLEIETRDTNRRLACLLTDLTRKMMRNNDLTVRIPWDEADAPRIGETWEVATIIACGDVPTEAGTIPFRITTEGVELDRPALIGPSTTKQRRRSNV